MAYGKSPSTCVHKVVLSLCVGSCLAVAALPRSVTVQQEIQTARVAHTIIQALVAQVPGMRHTSTPATAPRLETKLPGFRGPNSFGSSKK